MKEGIKYFIEDADTHEWYWFALGPIHVTSSDYSYRCKCNDCQGIEGVGFTNDLNKAFGFIKKEHAEDCLKKGLTRVGLNDMYIKNSDFYKGNMGYAVRNLIVTEHEFIN